MPRRTKPGVDWAAIEKAIRAGQSSTSLAKQHGVARQSIDKRANKEGWREGPQRWMPAVNQTRTARALESPQTAAEKHMATTGCRSPENAASILYAISQGMPQGIAAGSVGIAPETLRDWKKADPTFDRLVWQARQEHLGRQYGNIAKASDRGDWKAAQAILQAAPETKKDWSTGSSSGGVQVNISIRGADHLGRLEPPTVDVVADQVEINDSDTDQS